MKDQRTATSASERISLSLQGLGEQKIVVNKYGNSIHVHDKIIESFPGPADFGGYEILQISDDKSKNLIQIPNDYSVSYLKSTLGQAKAFIKPLQGELLLEVSDAIKVSTSFSQCQI